MNNTFGRGFNTVVAINGNDKTTGLVVARSVEEFLS